MSSTSAQDPQAGELPLQQLDRVVIRFAGDSGDGMQLAGMRFTDTSAIVGNDAAMYSCNLSGEAYGLIAGTSATSNARGFCSCWSTWPPGTVSRPTNSSRCSCGSSATIGPIYSIAPDRLKVQRMGHFGEDLANIALL